MQESKCRHDCPKRRPALTDRIGAIFSGACGSSRREQGASSFAGDEDVERRERTVALNRSHTCKQIQAGFSGIFRKRPAMFSFKKWRAIRMGFVNARGSKGPGSKPGFGRVEGRERSEMELCKKRILMGEKCRPLNVSGVLHYDKEGILLPEDVPI